MSLNTDRRHQTVGFAALAAVVAILCGVAPSYAAESYAGTPFGTSPFLIPARGESKLEAESFDRGAEGVAYHDADAANAGKQLRPNDGVDIGLCNDAGGGYRVGWISPGEWLAYTVRVSSAGKYNIVFRTSSRASAGAGGAKLHLEDEAGTNLTGDVSVPGSNDTWQDVRANNVSLPAGEHVLKLVFNGGGFNLNYLIFTATQGDPTPQAPVAQAPQGQQGMGEVVIVSEEAGAPAGAGDLPATSRLGVFAEESSIGTGEAKGQVSYAASGAYTLRGGTKIGGNADALYFLSGKSQGDGQIVAKVASVEGTGSAGVMYRESAAADARFAAVLVSAGNGTVFQRRGDTGGSVLSASAMGAKPPVWIRLVRSGTNYSAFYSASVEQPGDGEWKPIGSIKPVAMPADALAGLAAATAEGSALLASVSANLDAPAVVAVQDATAPVQPGVAGDPVGPLTGQVIGTEGSLDGANPREKAFDGNINTHFDPPGGPGMAAWTGLDFGVPRHITRIGFCPRATFASRMVNGKFQASNSPAFASGVVDLYTVTAMPPEGRMVVVDVRAPGAYRYFRYTGGTQFVSIAEIQVWGDSSAGSVLPGPAGVALTGSAANIEGKSFNLTSQTVDWVHWGNAGQTNRKASVPRRIGDLTGNSQVFNDNHVRYSWTDGSPAGRVDNTIEAVFRQGEFPFRFSVRPGDTRVHTLTIYVGGSNSTGDLIASLPGAAQYIDRGRGNVNDRYYFAYTIQFRAAMADDEVTIEWKQSAGGGNVQLHAATLR